MRGIIIAIIRIGIALWCAEMVVFAKENVIDLCLDLFRGAVRKYRVNLRQFVADHQHSLNILITRIVRPNYPG